MSKRPITQQDIDDLLLQKAILDWTSQNAHDLEKENQQLSHLPEYQVSPKTQEQIQRLVAKDAGRKRRSRRFRRLAAGFAASFIVLTITGVICILGVEGFGNAVLNVYLEHFRAGTNINLHDGVYIRWGDMRPPAYVPSGYEITGTDQSSDLVSSITYTNGDGDLLIYSQSPIASAGTIDTENALVMDQNIRVGRSAALYVQKKDKSILYWTAGDYAYMLQGILGKDELVKVAESIPTQ